MTQKENARLASGAGKAAELRRLAANYAGNDASNQRQRLRAALARFPLTTLEIRRDLDCLMPATRVFELRNCDGLDISTTWTIATTDAGKEHRVALYTLNSAGGAV
jgi:hypothetical protein